MAIVVDSPSAVVHASTGRIATNHGALIVQAIERRLRESSYYYLRTITAAYEAGVVTLTGRVPTFYLKQTVQALVEKIEGVERAVNLVDVVNPASA